jgi:nicotinate-nucleotide adenylyltransferase
VKRLGLFGGTFDPIHHGHLIAAQDVLCRLSLDSVIFVPADVPPHKTGRNAAAKEHRMAMVELAIRGNESFGSSGIELERGGVSYTVDTVAAFREECGSGTDLFFLLGSDNLAEIDTWRDPRRLADLCTLVGMRRPGFENFKIPSWLEGRYEDVEVTAIDISSRDIRDRVRNGLPVRYLVPPAVAEYIEREKLYRRPETA